MSQNIILTKNQIWQIANLFEKYNIDQIKIIVNNSSGIGQNIEVQYGGDENKIDITDYSNW